MELMTKAAISISDGEVIDAMIHSPQQHWSLMPHHAIASVIRPMSFVYGQSAAKNKMYGPAFPTCVSSITPKGDANRSMRFILAQS